MKLRRHFPFLRRLLRRLGWRLFHVAENNGNAAFAYNGEKWLLCELMRSFRLEGHSRAFIVVDAGANVGNYTVRALELAQKLACPMEIHAFEPLPDCVAALRRRFDGEPRVHIVDAALADRDGSSVIYLGKAGPSHSSLVARHDITAGTTQVRLLRLDHYLQSENLGHIDFLKLDVEGSELAILSGLGKYLQPERIDVIQFEYGGATLDAGTTLREIYQYLAARGYSLAKVFPSALELRPYEAWMENYAYANYAALSPRWTVA